MTDLDALRRRLADRGYTLVGLDPDPLTVPDTEPDDNPPAVIAWGCLAAVGWLLLIWRMRR